jgi:hypothetical protein
MDDQEEHYRGRTIVRNTEGKIVSAALSPKTASEMGKIRWAKPRAETKESLLQEAGYENPEDAPEHLRVLADIASSKRSGAVAALRDFLRLTHREPKYEEQAEPPAKLDMSDEAVKYLRLLTWFENEEYVEMIRQALADYDARQSRSRAGCVGKP